MTLGQWMRQRRLALDLSVGEAAQRAGMKDSVWSNWENDRSRRANGRPGRPRPETIHAIARSLDVLPQVVAEIVLAVPVEEDEDRDFASDMERRIRRIPNGKRAQVKRLIRQHVDNLVDTFSGAGFA